MDKSFTMNNLIFENYTYFISDIFREGFSLFEQIMNVLNTYFNKKEYISLEKLFLKWDYF